MKTLLAAWLLLVVAPQIPPTAQAPPRDARAPVRADVLLERSLRAEIAAKRATEASYFQLADLLKSRGDADAADTITLAARDAFPKSVEAQTRAATVYNQRGDFDGAIAALRAVAALQPESAEAQHRIAVFYWDKTRGDVKLDPPTKLSYILQGLDAENHALRLKPDYSEAMTYKNILLRLQANLSSDPVEKAQLIAEADELRNRVLAMLRHRAPGAFPAEGAGTMPVAFAGFPEPFEQAMARLTPVRVGGNLRTPTKIRDVKPKYPADVMRMRIQGVVILEALIDDSGTVANARVMRSVPLLDAAALEAVSQWVFTPTELNGRPVAVIMTVTVNFTLQ